MSDLKSRLLAVAERWAAAHDGAPLSRLGKPVAGDANFFDRLQRGGGINLATLEKFAEHLADPANWPEGCVPQEALDLAHAVGGSAALVAASAGNAGDSSPELGRDAA